MDEVARLVWDDVAPPAGAVSLVVRHGGFPAASVVHTHDFAELFVVESGGALHERDLTENWLGAGEVVFVLPEDTHRFVAPTSDFRITNVAFPHHVLRLIERAIPEAEEAWSGRFGHAVLDVPEKLRVLRLAHQLPRSNTRLRLAQLIVEILLSAESDGATLDEPGWVQAAFEAWLRDEEAMRDGVAGLARIAGRSRSHVSRVVRSTTGRRAIDLVNESRVELAATLLQTTDESIVRIASRVGFSSLSHFYQLFKRQLGTTPRAFRRTHKSIVSPTIPN